MGQIILLYMYHLIREIAGQYIVYASSLEGNIMKYASFQNVCKRFINDFSNLIGWFTQYVDIVCIVIGCCYY